MTWTDAWPFCAGREEFRAKTPGKEGICTQLKNIQLLTIATKLPAETPNGSVSVPYRGLRPDTHPNDGDLVRRWCVAGKGLAVKSCLDMSRDLVKGNVVSLMPEFKATPTELWLICPSRQSITPATRLLRDMPREKTNDVLNHLIENDILDDSVLN